MTKTNEPAPSDLAPILRRAYNTDTAIVYELLGSSPYVTTTQGCTFTSRSLDDFTIRCPKPGKLERRELWMQGWQATVGSSTVAVIRNGPFQTVSLPAGETNLTFRFAPPGARLSEGAAGLGLLSLVLLLGMGNWPTRLATCRESCTRHTRARSTECKTHL